MLIRLIKIACKSNGKRAVPAINGDAGYFHFAAPDREEGKCLSRLRFAMDEKKTAITFIAVFSI
jgi:hypothetical protein